MTVYNEIMLKLLCPVCKNQLRKINNSAVCLNGHTFDYAKEGYLYLLNPNSKNSLDPGDNKEMVLARHSFLSEGFYKPLADEISKTVNDVFDFPISLIDAGVGTGYYLHSLICSRDFEDDIFTGADISKYAAKKAAKLNPSAQICVASVFDMPYPDKCADVVLCVFSPYAMSEYSRILKDNGILIVVCPCENHLIELRKSLYENVRPVDSPLNTEHFDITEYKRVSFCFKLKNKKQICDLLAMTPYVYRAPLQAIEKLKENNEMSLTADFRLYILKKRR